MPGERLTRLATPSEKARIGDDEVTIRPFTIEEHQEVEQLAPADKDGMVRKLQLNRARLWVALRNVPGYETTWDEWCLFCDGEVYAKLQSVVAAIEKVNDSFRRLQSAAP